MIGIICAMDTEVIDYINAMEDKIIAANIEKNFNSLTS